MESIYIIMLDSPFWSLSFFSATIIIHVWPHDKALWPPQKYGHCKRLWDLNAGDKKQVLPSHVFGAWWNCKWCNYKRQKVNGAICYLWWWNWKIGTVQWHCLWHIWELHHGHIKENKSTTANPQTFLKKYIVFQIILWP